MEIAVVEIEYSEAKKRCKNIIKELYGNINIKNDIISFSTKTTLLSWGETISIRFNKVNSNTKISIVSESNAQIIDWGINNKNEKRILNEILNSII